MTYLFDTDHISILQRAGSAEHARLTNWMRTQSITDFSCSVVSLHEQVIGAHSYTNNATSSVELVRGYAMLQRLPKDYSAFPLLPFDGAAASIYSGLVALNLRIDLPRPRSRGDAEFAALVGKILQAVLGKPSIHSTRIPSPAFVTPH